MSGVSSQLNPAAAGPQSPKLLDRVRGQMQRAGYGLTMQNRYAEWCRRYVLFHGKKHPADMGEAEVAQFLAQLAIVERLPVAWQREARQALAFLYRVVLEQAAPLPEVRRERGSMAPATRRAGAGGVRVKVGGNAGAISS